jgi:hypothetical protein
MSRNEQTRLGEYVKYSYGVGPVQGANKERWKMLCEQAAIEQDPEKLHELVKEINDLLEAKEARLKDPALRQQSES